MRKAILGLFVLIPVALAAYTSPGKPSGFVNDFAHMLRSDTITTLNQTLTEFSQSTGNEMVVVTIDTHGDDETIETYAERLFQEWGIGKEKEDNGVLLLISKEDREMRIEVGYGLEPIITDIEASHIISDVLVPAFQKEDYNSGVLSAIERIMNDIKSGGSEFTGSGSSNLISNFDLSGLLYPIIFVFMFLSSVLVRSKSWWAGGVIGGIIGLILGIIWGFFYAGILGLVILIPLGLLFDFIVSRAHANYKDGGPRPPWFLGGSGGRMGGGGGFGGFGGGMSGGGGASGKW